MSKFTIGPLPCKNPESFTKLSAKKDTVRKTEPVEVVCRNVEGENNGECYKIKAPKTPFIINHLEKNYIPKPKETTKKRRAGEAGGVKREHSTSESDDQLEDANQPSTSSQQSSSRKKQRNQQDI
ncbi:DET1- and DDB1-associated protein 1 [Caenorhabditis elegans]|uniref:DET1- and DDB1-associated protein 1 n=1 Tax=Caenorhabditis elegans TaxID=6239 RepID=O01571_CAEEL|nr:DET1- and DDB1-associated protein 1 [Caenorhabditis elegans]CCD62472.1 DET1- and DDB1-associated protein 1 [Caenorhabditis elegans]|eukprot:NP_491565.1 Uncharacterized protein CELE_F48C1.5 [Caenorhabditis elegans]